MIYCREKAQEVVTATSISGIAAGLIPVPGGTSLALTGLETAMIAKIGRIYGENLTGAAAGTLIGAIMTIAGSSFLSSIAAELTTFIPVISWIIKPTVATTTIITFGEACIAFFETKYPNKVYKGK